MRLTLAEPAAGRVPGDHLVALWPSRATAAAIRDKERILAHMNNLSRWSGALAGAARQAYKGAIPYRYRLMLWAARQRDARVKREQQRTRDRAWMTRAYAELAATVARHPDRKGIFIFAPSANWTTELFQRPHQMALALAQSGYLVLYCVFIDSTDDVDILREIDTNLILCRVPPEFFADAAAQQGLEALADAVTLSYTANYPWVRRSKAKRIAYELIDQFEIFTDYPLPLLRRYHRDLLSRAQVVVGTATTLMAELTPYRADALLLPNGVDYNHFASVAAQTASAADAPDDLRPLVEIGHPIIGYYGALAEWFDYALWAEVARAAPDYTFVLLGPEYDLKLSDTALHNVPNIHWLGVKPYAILPQYLRYFTVATIPFVVNDTINAVSPIKLFEYMAAGKPIVTSDMVECRKYPVVHRATGVNGWVEQLRGGVAEAHDPAFQSALQAAARENTWLARAQTLASALETPERTPRLAGKR